MCIRGLLFAGGALIPCRSNHVCLDPTGLVNNCAVQQKSQQYQNVSHGDDDQQKTPRPPLVSVASWIFPINLAEPTGPKCFRNTGIINPRSVLSVALQVPWRPFKMFGSNPRAISYCTNRNSAEGRVGPRNCTARPSRPGELHPEALTDPCLSLSTHTARAIHGELAPSVTTRRFLPLPVDQGGHDSNGLPPSLRGHYSTSQLIRSSTPLADALVLWASRFLRLRLLP
jgi:hypothetical protein